MHGACGLKGTGLNMRSWGLGVFWCLALVLLGATAARAEGCLGISPSGHPSVAAMPDAYWATNPAWADLSVFERDFLARVSIATRNRRAQMRPEAFRNLAPSDIGPIPGASATQFATAGIPSLLALLGEARAFLAGAETKPKRRTSGQVIRFCVPEFSNSPNSCES